MPQYSSIKEMFRNFWLEHQINWNALEGSFAGIQLHGSVRSFYIYFHSLFVYRAIISMNVIKLMFEKSQPKIEL